MNRRATVGLVAVFLGHVSPQVERIAVFYWRAKADLKILQAPTREVISHNLRQECRTQRTWDNRL